MKKLLLTTILLATTINAQDIYATFNIEAKKSANLALSSGGIIDKVFVDVATNVKKGEVLVKLKNDDIKAMVEISKTAMIYAKKEYFRQLKVKSMIDKSKLDSYEFKYKNSKNQLIYQEAIFDKTILKAPFDGIIYEKIVENGDAVTGANPRTILKIQSRTARKLVLSFDQKYWKIVKSGQLFSFSVDGEEIIHTAKISKIYPYANSGNRKIKAEVEVDGFMVGLFGEGYIKVND